MNKSIFKNKKVLITGHTGFKGFWLALILKKLGAEVAGISLPLSNNSETHFSVMGGDNLFENYYQDIRDYDLLRETCKRINPDYVFHLAAQAIVSESYNRPLDTFTINTIGSLNVLEALRNISKVCRIIMITSDKVYENVEWKYGYREIDSLGGKDPYSASKSSAEIIIRSYFYSFLKNTNLKVVTARAGNVIGGGDWSKDRLVPDCIRSWMRNEEVVIRSPNSTRPWQHVFEPLNGYLTLAEKLTFNEELEGDSFNFGPNSSSEFKVIEALKIFQEKWGNDAKYIISDKKIFQESNLLKLNCDKSHSLLNWHPFIDFNECAELTITWYKNSFMDKNKIKQITDKQINWFLTKTKRNY